MISVDRVVVLPRNLYFLKNLRKKITSIVFNKDNLKIYLHKISKKRTIHVLRSQNQFELNFNKIRILMKKRKGKIPIKSKSPLLGSFNSKGTQEIFLELIQIKKKMFFSISQRRQNVNNKMLILEDSINKNSKSKNNLWQIKIEKKQDRRTALYLSQLLHSPLIQSEKEVNLIKV